MLPLHWRSRGLSICIHSLRYFMVLAVLQMLSCSNFHGDTYADTSQRTKEDTQAMTRNAEYLKEFNQLFLRISHETRQENLDSHLDDVDNWRMNWELDSGDVNLALISQLGFILEDQANRKQEQLTRKPGRQPAVDWVRELDNHQKRLGFELGALKQLQPGQTDADESIALISKGMELSIRVIAADSDQIKKQVDDRSVNLNPEQTALLQSSSELSRQASDWLATNGRD